MPKRIAVPKGAEEAYYYDSIRQQQKAQLEKIEKYSKLKKKVDKLSKK